MMMAYAVMAAVHQIFPGVPKIRSSKLPKYAITNM